MGASQQVQRLQLVIRAHTQVSRGDRHGVVSKHISHDTEGCALQHQLRGYVMPQGAVTSPSMSP